MRIFYFDLDSLRPDHLGCYGYGRPTSPNIDRVARQGMRFTRYYTSDSPCQPSRTALTTGRFGIHNGIVTHGQAHNHLNIQQSLYFGPEAENQLLQIRLRQAGVETYGFSTFPVRHCATWFGLGWSGFFTPTLKTGQESAAEINAAVLPWMRSFAARDSYFCYINYWDPHRPYRQPLSDWERHFVGAPVTQPFPDEATIAGQSLYAGPFTPTRLHGPAGAKSPVPLMPDAIRSRQDVDQLFRGYDAMIHYADHHVGQVLQELERQHLLQDAAIIISADHGEAFGEHGIYADHACADECVHRVPLIVHWPRVTAPGSVCEAMLYNVDLAATLCELVGAKVPALWDGQSFASHLRKAGRGDWERDHLVWGHGLYTLQRAVRTRRHLLVRTYHPHEYSQFPPLALFDLDRDPYQASDICAAEPEKASELEGVLDDWLRTELAKPGVMADPMQAVLASRLAAAPR